MSAAHLNAMSAAEPVLCGPPAASEPTALAAALACEQPDGSGRIRGVGYSAGVAGCLDSAGLDRPRGNVPVRVQHQHFPTVPTESDGNFVERSLRSDCRAIYPASRGQATQVADTRAGSAAHELSVAPVRNGSASRRFALAPPPRGLTGEAGLSANFLGNL
jgi:hypothetical protein